MHGCAPDDGAGRIVRGTRRSQRDDAGRCAAGKGGYSSTGSNWSGPTPQTGHTKSSGSSGVSTSTS